MGLRNIWETTNQFGLALIQQLVVTHSVHITHNNASQSLIVQIGVLFQA